MACQPSGSIAPGAKEKDRAVGSSSIVLNNYFTNCLSAPKKQKPLRTFRRNAISSWLPLTIQIGMRDKWRRGQDSNLHILSDGGFQDRCTTNYATPPLRS